MNKATQLLVLLEENGDEIVAIESVVDTRDYEEGPDDKWVPIPGSGDKRCCDRCGRNHEIHWQVTVKDSGGKKESRVMGGGCAQQMYAVIDTKEVKSLASASISIKKMETQLAAYKALLDDYKKIKNTVERQSVPDIEEHPPEFSNLIKTLKIKVGQDKYIQDGVSKSQKESDVRRDLVSRYHDSKVLDVIKQKYSGSIRIGRFKKPQLLGLLFNSSLENRLVSNIKPLERSLDKQRTKLDKLQKSAVKG